MPRRKLGEKSLAQLGYWADAHGTTAWDALTRLDEMSELAPAARGALADFRDLIGEVRSRMTLWPLNVESLRTWAQIGAMGMAFQPDPAIPTC